MHCRSADVGNIVSVCYLVVSTAAFTVIGKQNLPAACTVLTALRGDLRVRTRKALDAPSTRRLELRVGSTLERKLHA